VTGELFWLSAADLDAAYAAKKLSPVEATRAVLDRIDAVDPALNAFCYRDDGRAMAAARASEKRRGAGTALSPLDGVPISIKDLILTEGWPTLCGSLAVDPAGPWDRDAPLVKRLRAGGAVLIGKTTTPEFGNSGITDSPLTGLTVNPWDTGRTPGGSSGGSVAAVAAGCGPISIGSDGGGSIRTPASFCNLVGIKASFGRVPQDHGNDFGQLSASGPVSRTVRDNALAMNLIARYDPTDWHALPDDGCDYLAGLDDGVAGLKIAYSGDLGFAPVDPEVAAVCRQAIDIFRGLGATVEEATPEIGDPTAWFDVLWHVLAAASVDAMPEDQQARLGHQMLESAEMGRGLPAGDLLDADRQRGRMARTMIDFHRQWDLLVTPACAILPFPNGHDHPPDWGMETGNFEVLVGPFNATKQPAVTVPCGFSRDGLPIGLQIVGRLYEDALVLRAAQAFESANPQFDRHPTL
jgi:aspartyl-tRNA(Asn)/glutamyl-tRNA(Gln) amidotransferase subunit A